MSRRIAVIGGLIAVAFAIGAFLVFETDPLLFHESPLRLIDPSIGPEDRALVAYLERALAGRVELPLIRPAPPALSRDPYLNAVVVGALTDAQFRARAAAAPGWDELVVVRAYEHGAELELDPAIRSAFLRWQLRHTDGPPQDGYSRVVVIRRQRTVGTIYLKGDLETSGVISRSR